MKTVYLNSSYERTNTLVENGFEVDEQLADTIILLNKKGYKTINSCAGHYKDDTVYKETVPKNTVTKEEFFKYLNQHDLRFLGEDENNYYYEGIILGEATYIMFDKDVVLPFYPEGFVFDETFDYEQTQSFELFRNELKDIEIITYNELIFKLKLIQQALEDDNLDVKINVEENIDEDADPFADFY